MSEPTIIGLARCLLMDLLKLPVYNLIHDDGCQRPAGNLKYRDANISKKAGGSDLLTISYRLSQAQKNRLEVLNKMSLDSQWKILMNTWRLFGSTVLDEERKARESNRRLLDESNRRLLDESNRRLLDESNRRLLDESNQQLVVYQSQSLSSNLEDGWKFLKMELPESIPLLFWFGLHSNPGLERLQAARKHEQRVTEALHQEPNYEYYKNLIQPKSWKTQPLKFDHTMNNGNEMMYIPIRKVYPLSLQNGYELLCLWKYEHLKFLYEDLFLMEEDHSYESLKAFVQNIKARLAFLKSQFEHSILFSRLKPYEMTPNEFFDCDWTEQTKFREIMKSNTCTEWCKMDVKGDSYTGYWRSEDPTIQNNAWDLTWEDNFNHIYDHLDKKNYYGPLSPLTDMNIYYPLTMMYVIEYLCASRCEAPVEVIDFYEFFINHVVIPNYEVLMAEDKPLHFIV